MEDLPHYILECPLYLHPRARFIDGALYGLKFDSVSDKLIFLLSDNDSNISYRMSLFATAAKKIRTNIVLSNVVN